MAAAAFGGLVVGVAALVIAVALLSGFQAHVRGRLVAETPHVLVEPAGRAAFAAEEGVRARLAAIPDVRSVAPVARGRIWLSHGGRSATGSAVGREDAPGLTLDSAQAGPIGAYPGDVVTVVSSRTRLSPLGPVPLVVTRRLERVAAPGSGRRMPDAVLPLADARRLFGLADGEATAYEIRVADPARVDAVASAIRAALGAGVLTKTWEEANRSLVLALRLERTVLFATVFLIVVVAGLNLAATSAVLAATRVRDAAVLQVLGAARRTVGRVFLTAGAAVGAAGTVAGLSLGVALAILADRLHLVPLPGDVFALSSVPFRVEPRDLATIGALSLLWSVASAAVPARAAARVDVLEALRG